jgi:hypothetical protein
MGLPTRDEQYLEVVKIVKAKNKRITNMEKGGLSDEEILLNVREVEQSILNYCQIPRVPPQLHFVWANMTVDLILYFIEINNTPEDLLDGLDVSDLSSIKVGDTSIYIGDKYRSNQRSRTLQSHNSNLDELVMNYTKQLNQFRRIL